MTTFSPLPMRPMSRAGRRNLRKLWTRDGQMRVGMFRPCIEPPLDLVAAKIAEHDRIIRSFDVFDVPEWYRTKIRMALASPRWDWYSDCDGCTGVREPWASRYFPPCLGHDFDCLTATTDEEMMYANREFEQGLLIYKFRPAVARVWRIAVDLAWWGWYRYRNVKGQKG